MIPQIFLLLVAYQIKHFVCDYPLQGEYMLRKFSRDPRIWVPALAAHAGVQALGTMVIAGLYLGFNPWVLALMGMDFATHFVMDRFKADPDLLGRFKPLTGPEYQQAVAQGRQDRILGNKFFWWALGFDQMVHHLTHYVIIYILITLR